MMLPIMCVLFFVGSRYGKSKQQQAKQETIFLEQNMPHSIRNEVLRALASDGEDAATLNAFAETLRPTFPIAAYELACKAWVCGGRFGSLPAPPG